MSSGQLLKTDTEIIAQRIRVRGLVQGVGFRPCVWRFAKELGITGNVINDADGVLIEAWGCADQLNTLCESIRNNGLPLAKVEQIEVSPHSGATPNDFLILKSNSGEANTAVAAEAASCAACIEDTMSAFSRRYRYPFTNCTHCGPRLSIVKSIPYDRKNTSMSVFPLCPECKKEYDDPADRRYHAQPTACHACGPKAVLRRSDGRAICIESLTQLDEIDAAATLIQKGEIIAIKALGGYQLCCDATNDDAVRKLRQRKKRFEKPFALMARNLDVIRQYCELSEEEAKLLSSTSSPIVLMEAKPGHKVSTAVAPGISTLGFMLPNTPLHHLLLKRIAVPIVCSSGNLSEEPQCIDNDDAQARLADIADYILDNNRDIVNRLDDSVLRLAAGSPRMLRRSRGYAPAPLRLPDGFSQAPQILALRRFWPWERN
jgi:hydrogenase maturation protein HypF